jgi:hypothetical protein
MVELILLLHYKTLIIKSRLLKKSKKSRAVKKSPLKTAKNPFDPKISIRKKILKEANGFRAITGWMRSTRDTSHL